MTGIGDQLHEQTVETVLGRIRLQVGGSGSPIVFWPSLLRTGDMWHGVAGDLVGRWQVVLVDPPGQGGLNLFHTTVGGTSMSSPLTNFAINSSCDGDNWFGWPCDAKTEELRTAYIRAAEEVPSRAALEALHSRLWETLPDIPVGQYVQPSAWRSNVTGVLRTHLLVFWSIDKD